MMIGRISGRRPSTPPSTPTAQPGRTQEPTFSARRHSSPRDASPGDRVTLARNSAGRVRDALPRDEGSPARRNPLDHAAVAVLRTFRKVVPQPLQAPLLGIGAARLAAKGWNAVNPKWSSVPHADVTFPGQPSSSINWPEVNCYSFVSGDRSGKHGQPGQRSGRMYGAITCDEITAAAIRDGYVPPIKDDGCDSECPPGHRLAHFRTTGDGQAIQHLKGLFSTEKDFHVYASTRGPDGRMRTVHKQGQPGVPTDKDGSGRPIGCPVDERVNHHYVVNEGIGPFKFPSHYNYSVPCGDFLCAPDEPAPPKGRSNPFVTKDRIMGAMSATAAAVLSSQLWLSHRLGRLDRQGEAVADPSGEGRHPDREGTESRGGPGCPVPAGRSRKARASEPECDRQEGRHRQRP